MNNEKNLIIQIAKHLPKCKDQLNQLFESDSEIVPFPFPKMLFTIDEFSSEDHFREDDPFLLGWNLAVATLSDIYASVGKPVYFGHSLVIDKKFWDQDFIDQLSMGIAAVLRETNTCFIGGDFGCSDQWHYSGIAIGTAEKTLMRTGTKPGEIIIMTGKAGAGNLEAGLKLFKGNEALSEIKKRYRTSFILRAKEAELINRFATSCIDSSDGIVNALLAIADLNGVGFSLKDVQSIAEGEVFCKLLSLPVEILFLGECGEYELVFTLKENELPDFEKEAELLNLSFSVIGKITESPPKTLITSNLSIDLTDFTIRGRDYADSALYLSALTNYLSVHAKKMD